MENILESLPKAELINLINHYDSYIQDANTKNSYEYGWRPVCINEFYDNEYQEILENNK